MTRSRSTTLLIAIVLLAVLSLLSLIPVGTPPFTIPEGAVGPPAIIIYGSYVLGILGLIAAVWLWLRKKWAWILALIVSTLSALSAAPGIFEAPTTFLKISCVVGTVAGIVFIALLVLPSSRQALASGVRNYDAGPVTQ